VDEGRFWEKLAAIAPTRRQEPMAFHTTFRIGGPADFFAAVATKDQLRRLVSLAREESVSFFLLGAGSNILVSDCGVRGLVIENRTAGIEQIVPDEAAQEGSFRVESGVALAKLAHQSVAQGWQGLEWAAGIPGTVGGAIVYNAGAFGGCLAQALKWAELLLPNDEIKQVAAEELGLGYRASAIRSAAQKAVILSAELELTRGCAGDLRRRVTEQAAHRRERQPNLPSAGSVFKNPPGNAAGRLIEQAGLKGHRVGDAQVSEKHANFIVNRGQARARDVIELISLVRDKVNKRFGIPLELEVELVGEY